MDDKKRTWIQAAAALLQNLHFRGFPHGEIYQGTGKNVCVPGLNCYSCPGAVGSCPIGSLQNALSGFKFRFPYYVVGLLLLFGTLVGRLICGFLCPFGFLQDLMYRIPFVKKIRSFRADQPMRYVKYLVLLVMVIILPICIKLTPIFCKYLCPSGTVSGILLALGDHTLWKVLGSRFAWKLSLLIIILLGSILIARPFCKYLCPLGAIYGLLNRYSVLQLKVEESKCVHCSACANVCDMNVDPVKNASSSECIRCGKCIHQCPKDAIHFTNIFKK